MIRTFKYRLHPSRIQERVLFGWLDVCRDIYNAALQERRDAWSKAGVSVTRYDQQKELTEIRREDEVVAEVPAVVARSPIMRLDMAFRAFFRRCKTSEKPGYPRFKGRDRFRSFAIPPTNGNPLIDGRHLLVPKLGRVRIALYRAVDGEIREATVSHVGGKWWVSFACEVGEAPAKVAVRSATGIDLGLTMFATLSNGDEIKNPRFFKSSEERIARLGRALATKRRGSASRAKAKLLLRRAHEKIANQRRDFARKLAAMLFRRYDLVAHEALEIAPLAALDGGRLQKSIRDVSWGAFLGALACKAESAGKWAVPLEPRGTTKRCSGCGEDVPKALWQRTHACPRCGLTLGRDHNAALNILRLGQSRAGLLVGAPAGASAYGARPMAVGPVF